MFNLRKHGLESAEFARLVKCCRLAFGRAGERAETPPVPAGLDWTAFLALARRHRVQGIVWRSLHSVRDSLPEEVAEALSGDAQTIGRHGMECAVESARLLDALSSADVQVLFVKGLPLSRLAYGDPFVKMSSDIDILIDIAQLPLAESALRELGYELTLPRHGASSDQLQRWHDSRKESVWRRKDIIVELHTRLADNRRLLPSVDAHSPRQLVDIAHGIALPTLAADQQFAYLCVHGASSAWFRLKWLADLAAILSGCSESEVARLYHRSQQLGAGRSAAQALLLAQAVFSTRLDQALGRELASQRANRWLARLPWREMTKLAAPTETRFGTAAIHLTQFLLLPGIRFKFEELRRQLGDAAINRA